MPDDYYAHSLDGKPPSDWQPLEEHLRNVAEKARSFAASFGAGGWAYLAGLWHDLGKFSIEFQEMINSSYELTQKADKHARIDHSTAGGRYASENLPGVGKLLAYAILGHHGGMPNGKSSYGLDLISRLDREYKIPVLHYSFKPKIDKKLALPFNQEKRRIGFQTSLFIRMIFSCLVDADFLDTEKFLDTERSSLRQIHLTIMDFEKPLFERLKKFKPNSSINKKRSEILESCIKAADEEPGFFTLSVPTGGGKTLSSMAFAVRHALRYGKNRIIYAIPFTSIIEQNADVFRDIFGDNSILEHHSNYAPEDTNEGWEDNSPEAMKHRLACENWNSPLVLTTNVQFFESLFANRPAKCRKLHNIVNSVIILDEAQMLPERYLRPCLEVLKELAFSYNCTIVLCTATQPALLQTETFPYGLMADNVREIMPNPKELFDAFKRVRFHDEGKISDEGLISRISENEQILCIVNTRLRAAELFKKINHLSGAYHLSARMCPAHRSEVLFKIRESLKNDKPCRVISTQLVEAGVDLDFPTVYREMAGLDSIAQSAGRCNREGKLENGDVYVFLPESGKIPRMFRRAAGAAESVFRRFQDPFSPDAIEDYFSQVYWLAGDELDEKQIMRDIEDGVTGLDFPFKEVAAKFNLIDDAMSPVIIPWNEKSKQIIDRLEYAEFPGPVLRQLQRFTVQTYEKEFRELLGMGALYLAKQRYPVLISLLPYYGDDIGLNIDQAEFQIEDLVF